jgi:hypothetical protein
VQRRVSHGAALRATSQRFQLPASKRATNKLATPVARRSENAGRSATASFDITEMSLRTAVFYH